MARKFGKGSITLDGKTTWALDLGADWSLSGESFTITRKVKRPKPVAGQ